ncbi:MAG: ribose 5-phosphate isomerase B [Helicobacteraceae bacterium]|jgi:ribose 5-phosphate isomerase B|nr:ribose 5-phosphate isomerase B [Helicobacteraceae bacterium]
MEKIFIGGDHAAIEMKNAAIAYLRNTFRREIIDVGAYDGERVDYPDYAAKVCEEVLKDKEAFGILICGTGIGMSIAANKHKGVRAALARNSYEARMAREHNDANVLCLGARTIGLGIMESVLDSWVSASFEGGRHSARLKKIAELEDKCFS